MAREAVKAHISKFQTVPSHYCSHSSSKQYLPQNLSLSEMYRMYVNECRMKNTAKKHMYVEIFKKDFNLAFHRPKKDMYDFCKKYARSNDDEREHGGPF